MHMVTNCKKVHFLTNCKPLTVMLIGVDSEKEIHTRDTAITRRAYSSAHS
jgi:hypothetical protein